jgi:hypothetical protein
VREGVPEKRNGPARGGSGDPSPDLLRALARLGKTLGDSRPLVERALDRSSLLAGQYRDGGSWSDIVLSEDAPALHLVVNEIVEILVDANALYRRAMVEALRRDGLTMQRIADLLGVTRQRVSHLLRRPDSR